MPARGSDSYTLANPSGMPAPAVVGTSELVNDAYLGPLTVIDRRGQVVQVIPPR